MNNGSGSKGRWMMSLHLKGRKERDNEDLHLFRELHKRDKERTACLLLPVSDDLEHSNGNSPFYRIQSIKKDHGFELLSEGSKNDYDWYKKLFNSYVFGSGFNLSELVFIHGLVKAQNPTCNSFVSIFGNGSHWSSYECSETVITGALLRYLFDQHRKNPKMLALGFSSIVSLIPNISVIYPLKSVQASSNSEATKRSNGMEKSPTTKPKIPSRSITPSHRLSINSSTEPKNTKRTMTPTPNQRTTQASADLTSKRSNTISSNIKSIHLKETCTDFLTSNLSKGSTNTAIPNPNPNPRSRTTSPIVRSTIASQIPEFSNETPPNLMTDRSSSVTRGRQVHQPAAATAQKAEAINPRRQSCSPSVTRGRKVEAKQEMNKGGSLSNDQRRSEATNVLGSRMVERVMNARKSNGNEERDTKTRARNGIGDAGFISKSSADQTIRQLIRRK